MTNDRKLLLLMRVLNSPPAGAPAEIANKLDALVKEWEKIKPAARAEMFNTLCSQVLPKLAYEGLQKQTAYLAEKVKAANGN